MLSALIKDIVLLFNFHLSQAKNLQIKNKYIYKVNNLYTPTVDVHLLNTCQGLEGRNCRKMDLTELPYTELWGTKWRKTDLLKF